MVDDGRGGGSGGADEVLVVRTPRRRGVLLGTACAAFAWMPIAVLSLSRWRDGRPVEVNASVVAFVALASMFMLWMEIADPLRRQEIRADSTGIRHPGPHVRWSDIDAIVVRSRKHTRWVVVYSPAFRCARELPGLRCGRRDTTGEFDRQVAKLRLLWEDHRGVGWTRPPPPWRPPPPLGA